MTRPMPALPTIELSAFATLLRQHRQHRRMSQLDLALACDISARHLSYLETGRAKPSRDMVGQLSDGLFLPLGARNGLLAAAGFSPSYPASPLGSDVLQPFREILEEMMARHAPFPAMLCDRHWTILDANATARALLSPLHGEANEMNIIRMLTASPLAPVMIANYADVLIEMRGRIALEALEAAGDRVLSDLLSALDQAVRAHPAKAAPQRQPLMPVIVNTPAGPLAFLSTIAHFGTSEDVTIRDLRLELLFPADAATRAAMMQMAES